MKRVRLVWLELVWLELSWLELSWLLFLLIGIQGVVAGEASAREVWRRGDASVALTGSLRELANIGEQTDANAFMDAFLADPNCSPPPPPAPPMFPVFADCSAFDTVGEKDAFQSLTRLRLRLDVEITPSIGAVVVYDNELFAGELDTFEGDLAGSFTGDDLFEADWTPASGSRAEWRHLFYRGFVRYEKGALDVVVGRQRIAWGVGRLWNPIDRFNAIPPLAIQGDQSPGIDSIDARWALDGFSFVEAVYAPGSSRDNARYALRLHGVLYDTDLSLVAGVFEKAPTFGVDLARNVGDAALRVEAVYTDPEESFHTITQTGTKKQELHDFWQVVVSVDYNLEIGTGVYTLVEHLYNGNDLGFGKGKAGSLQPLFEAGFSTAVFGTSRVVTAAEHQTGVSISGDLSPELRLELLSIYDWTGESAVFAPSVRWSPSGSFEVSAGVQTFVGRRRSQYGGNATLVFLFADFYF